MFDKDRTIAEQLVISVIKQNTRTNQEVEVPDALVLAHQRRRQAQLAVRLDDADHLGRRACARARVRARLCAVC